MQHTNNNLNVNKGSNYSFTIIIAMVLSIATVIFSLQNAITVTVKFLAWEVDAPLSILLILTLFSGVIISLLFSIPGWFKKRKVVARLNKEINSLKSMSASTSARNK